VDTQNSQKKSRHSSAKSEKSRSGIGRQEQQQRPVADFDHEEYMDRSNDHVARVRAAKEAAQREMESFGDVSEYDIAIIRGQLKEEPAAAPSQTALAFEDDAPDGPRGTK
jgi:hypothetical protein